MSALLLVDKLAEVLLVALPGHGADFVFAQLARQLGLESLRRRIFLERMIGVVGQVGNQSIDPAAVAHRRDQQQDAGQARTEHRQVAALLPSAVEHQPGLPLGQREQRFVGVVLDVVGEQRNVRGDRQGIFLALRHFVLQHRLRDRFIRQQVAFEVLFVLCADVQFPAQRLELTDAHRLSDRQHIKVAEFVGFADEVRTVRDLLVAGEVVQGGLQQRYLPGGDAVGEVERIPGIAFWHVQAQPRSLDVAIAVGVAGQFNAVAFLEHGLQQWGGEGGQVDPGQQAVDLVLRTPGFDIGDSELFQIGSWCVGVPGLGVQWRRRQCLASSDRGGLEVVIDCAGDKVVVPPFVRCCCRHGESDMANHP